MGFSDAGAHCGAICDEGMPTFMLTHWTRDRARGEKLPLAHVIKRQTMDTARFFELNDRGIIAPGYRADINVIDYENPSLGRPEVVHDLPAGGRRWHHDRQSAWKATARTSRKPCGPDLIPRSSLPANKGL